MKLYELNSVIAAVAPVEGINSDGAIWFRPEATDEQKAAAQALMDQHLPDLDLAP